MDWKTAGFQDFLNLDNELYPQLPQAYKEGTHFALFSAILHSPMLRPEYHQNSCALNEMSAFQFIRDHGDLPLTPETILRIYGAMLNDSSQAGWKKSNVYLKIGDRFYVTLPAEETPEAMEALCLEYAALNDPKPEQFDEIFKFVLTVICIHPFEDGNGRMSALLLQFLLQKAGLKCAVYLPLDVLQNGIYRERISREIRKASGTFYGMKPLEYDAYIAFMKEILAYSYQIMITAAGKIAASI